MDQRKIGTLISYLQMLLGIVVSLVYTPYMIQLLGQSEYGLYNTVASTISMLSVLSLGFNSSYIRYYARYKQTQDEAGIRQLNGLFLLLFGGIGLVALGCGLFLANHLQLIFDAGLTAGEYALARKLVLLLTVNLAVSFPMSVFANIISAHEQFVFLKLLGVVKTVCGPLVTLPLLLAGYRSVAVVAVTILISFLTDGAYLFYVLVRLKEKFVFSRFKNGILLEMTIYTSFIAVNLLVDQINWNVDKLLLARYCGTAEVAVYSVGYTLYSYYSMVSTAVSGVFTPLIHRIINRTASAPGQQRRELTELFIRVGRVQFMILGLFATGLIFFGRPFIGFWAGEEYDAAYAVVLLLALPATVPLIQNVGIEIQRAENRHQFRSVIYLLMALVNLGVSIQLCQWWGAAGSALGTALSLLLANGLAINLYYHKRCNVDILAFWRSILQTLPGLVLPVVAGTAIYYFVTMDSLLELGAWALLYTAVYALGTWRFGLNQREKAQVIQALRWIGRRGPRQPKRKETKP